MNRKTTLTLAALATAALLAGCASGIKLQDTPVETRTPTPVGAATAGQTPAGGSVGSTGSTPQSQVATVDLTKQGAGAGAVEAAARIVYFDFDSFVIKDEYKPLVEGHAKAMVANKQRRMVVEGHADERGSREYNLALGQKRAEAVVRSLALLGVGPAQVEAVSFGEERPAAQGSDEAAWARNRRAELKDR
jgi:peptidoglycan-associated lipoprotein